MQNLMEDFYIPMRGNDTSTKIETLGGLQYDGITDVNYLRDKLFAALRIPKAFLGYDEKLQGKATLAAKIFALVERLKKSKGLWFLNCIRLLLFTYTFRATEMNH
jgi:hypothetical protein